MKKIKIILLIGILVLTTSVPSISAASVEELQQQQAQVKAQLNANSDKLAQTMNKVNAIYQQLNDLQAQKQETTVKIQTATKQLQQAKKEKQQRTRDANQRLRELQLRQGTNTTLSFLEKAQNLTQWLSSVIVLQRLQNVYNDSMQAVKQSVDQLNETQNKLANYQADLQRQSDDLQQQQAQLNKQVEQLKSVMAQSQSKLKDLANQEQQAKAIEEAQAKQAQEAAAKQQAQAQQQVTNDTANVDLNGAKTLTMQATGYSTEELGASVYSATGINLRQNSSCVAVDPSVIPLGSIVWVSGYGVSIAGDTGGAIKGNIIDLHFATVAQAINWGRRTVTVKVLS